MEKTWKNMKKNGELMKKNVKINKHLWTSIISQFKKDHVKKKKKTHTHTPSLTQFSAERVQLLLAMDFHLSVFKPRCSGATVTSQCLHRVRLRLMLATAQGSRQCKAAIWLKKKQLIQLDTCGHHAMDVWQGNERSHGFVQIWPLTFCSKLLH